jgi:signal transduction histidine kinase/putative methionine-R-sulfoxide reductase with GAF domain
MRRGPKPAKSKEAKPPVGRKSPKDDGSGVRDLEKRLTEALKDKAEAQDQRAATSEILKAISTSPTDVRPVFDMIAKHAVKLCGAELSVVTTLKGDHLDLVAVYGLTSEGIEATRGAFPMPLNAESTSARAIRSRAVVHFEDVIADAQYQYKDTARIGRWRGTLGVPLLRETQVIGAIMVARTTPGRFSDTQIALLQTFADQAVIAIENVRLFNETKEALEQQTATAEILRVISSSPTDVQPVYDSIVERAARLCDAEVSLVARLEGEWIHVGAVFGTSVAGTDAVRQTYPMRPGAAGATARAIRDSAIAHIPDVLTDPEFTIRDAALTAGFRAVLAVPMLREGRAIGAISIGRAEAGEFSTEQVNLLRTFADQAVIAIENVRLFTELQKKNQALTTAHGQIAEALEQQTATSEILRVISQSPTDIQPVFDAILRSAVTLCGAEIAAMFPFDGKLVHMGATYNWSREALEYFSKIYPSPPSPSLMSGRTILSRSVVMIADAACDPHYDPDSATTGHWRRMLGVPMLREGQPLGALVVTWREPGDTPQRHVDMLQTFADQAVIAIENVRLFKELEAANRELATASQHKSEFLANMSHELRTPLNAIIGFSEVLSEKMFGELNEKQEEYSNDIHASGQHLLSLINDILDLSKIEAGRMELELSDFDLPTAIDNALTLVRERAGRRGITLQMNVDNRLGQVQADERKVRQVVLNLLSNAIKFTPEGGRIEVAAAPKDVSIEVSVSDTGVGIAPEDQEAVFEEFRQVGTADKKVEGTGLGLTLCRKFVELHGGRIWVKSEVGVGSTFAFTIPARRG